MWSFSGCMPGRSSTRPPYGPIAELAAVQHGVVAGRQLRELGLSRSAIESGLRLGRLHAVHRGTYAVGHPRLTRHGRWMAATLACGAHAVLSHRSAAVLWRLSAHEGRIEVTIAATSRRTRFGLTIHRSRCLLDQERAVRDAIPVTTPARTVMDLASVLPRRHLERAMDEAHRLRLTTTGELHAVASAHPGHRGAAALIRTLAAHAIGSTLTRSVLEERFLALCRDHGITQPDVNVRVGRCVVDFLWPAHNLIVETDGYETHGTRRAFEDDHDRDARLMVLGYRVLRFTYRQVAAEPLVVANLVRSALGQS